MKLKKMIALTLAMLAVTLIPPPAEAAVGKSVAECARLYGAPTAYPAGAGDSTYHYRWRGKLVTCKFVAGRCTRATYTGDGVADQNFSNSVFALHGKRWIESGPYLWRKGSISAGYVPAQKTLLFSELPTRRHWRWYGIGGY